MSYILDALRKSEQDREQHQLPRMAAQRLMPPVEEKKSILSGVLVLVVVLNLLVVGYVVYARYGLTAVADTSLPDASVPEVPAPAPNPTQETEPLLFLMSEPVQRPAHTLGLAAQNVETADGVDWLGPAEPMPSISPPTPPPSVVPVAPVIPAVPTEAATPTPALVEADALPALVHPVIVPAEVVPVVETQPEAEVVVPEAAYDVPNFTHLPFSIRKKLADLQLTIHIYAQQSADRRVYLNNQRMKVGDNNRKGLKVERIVRAGVILSFQGTRFLLRK